jgi:nitrogen-specific signal transduction histidine kinase
MEAAGPQERRSGLTGRRRLDRVLAVVPNAILVFERSGRCAYANSAATDALGMEPTQAVGRALDELGLPPHLASAIVRATSTGVARLRGNVRLATPMGRRRYEYLLSPLGEDGSVVVGLHEVSATQSGDDVPPRQLEQERSDQLRQICHDLRTRLTVVLNWGQMLSRGSLSPEAVREGGAAVVSSARRMSELVNAVVDAGIAAEGTADRASAPTGRIHGAVGRGVPR